MLEYIKGNIFNTRMQTVVNTVNCVGVMGKGIALVYKLRYPKMYDQYKELCTEQQISIGKLWIYNKEKHAPWVLNFPTKKHWKDPSRIEYLEMGLDKFVRTYEQKGITSIAFPLLGAQNGGLDKKEVVQIMARYLSQCKIPVEIYEYDADVADDLFESFKTSWNSITPDQIKIATGIRIDKIRLINSELEAPEMNNMISLINAEGIGLKTMEKCFRFVMNHRNNPTLF